MCDKPKIKNENAAAFSFKIDLLMQNSLSAAFAPFRGGRAKRLIFHQQSDFAFLDVILGQERALFSKFHDFQIFHLNNGNLEGVQTFHSAYGSS